MVNLAVPYVRPDGATRSVANECIARWGTPARPSEFVTGYKSATNYSGHNADSNGITHAVDIFTGPGNIPAADGIWLANHLAARGKAGDPRVFYVIHNDQIASASTGWQFAGSGYGHFDHVHYSSCDLYWGDPSPITRAVYDDTGAWNITTLGTAAGTIEQIEEDPLAGLSYEDIKRASYEGTLQALEYQVPDAETGTPTAVMDVARIIRPLVHDVPKQVMQYQVPRGGEDAGTGKASLEGVVAYFDQSRYDTIKGAVAAAKGDGATAEQILQAVKDGLAAGITVDVTVGGQHG